MCDATGFRDSTRIVVRRDALAGLRSDIASEFTVTIREEGPAARIIGSPVGINERTDYQARGYRAAVVWPASTAAPIDNA